MLNSVQALNNRTIPCPRKLAIMWGAAVETHHSSCEHLLGEVNVDFRSQEGPSGEPVQPHSSLLGSSGKTSKENLGVQAGFELPTWLKAL